MRTRPVLVLSKRQCPILSYAKRGAFRNLARACDPVIPIIYNSSRKGVLGRIGWTNCLANLAYRSSRSGLQMNSRSCLRLINSLRKMAQ